MADPVITGSPLWLVVLGAFTLLMVLLICTVAIRIKRLAELENARRARRAELARMLAQTQGPGVPDSLPAAVRGSLPSFKFHPQASDSRLCAICLEEFEEGEEVLSLPCKHQFHSECVSLWCDSHSNCPTCRNSLLSPTSAQPPAPPPAQLLHAQASSADPSPAPVPLLHDVVCAIDVEAADCCSSRCPSQGADGGGEDLVLLGRGNGKRGDAGGADEKDDNWVEGRGSVASAVPQLASSTETSES